LRDVLKLLLSEVYKRKLHLADDVFIPLRAFPRVGDAGALIRNTSPTAVWSASFDSVIPMAEGLA
jgi:hypothetical protein